MIVLSHFQTRVLLQSKDTLSTIQISPDLGCSLVEVQLGEAVFFPDGISLSWDMAAEIADTPNKCFLVDAKGAHAIQKYSHLTNRLYALYPTESAPTMLVSGIPMHRIKGTDPWQDTQTKINAFGRVAGHVLDTTTGLGYTAILAAESADRVTTIELDSQAQEIAKLNPWSQVLFQNPKIHRQIGDSSEVIETFPATEFSGIIHDPPMFSLAGELYSLGFYQCAYRVLRPRGCMFHYIGNPKSRSGARVTQGVIRRLKEAGFSRVLSRPAAFGVVAYK